jgi:hypothetical protein
MKASNDGRAMPRWSIWVFVAAWVLLALNGIHLADRAYGAWWIANDVGFAWAMVMTVIVGQLSVGVGSYCGTKWARQGRTLDAILAWVLAIAGIASAFGAAYPDLFGRWNAHVLAVSINVMGPIGFTVWLRFVDEATGERA